jgi:hypothetical protein
VTGSGGRADEGGRPAHDQQARAERAVRGAVAATLCLEALTVLFVPRAIAQFGVGLTTPRLVFVLGLAGLLLVTAFLLRSWVGLVVGSALQVGVLATGLLTGAMYVVGALFALTWVYLLWLRRELARRSRPSPPR